MDKLETKEETHGLIWDVGGEKRKRKWKKKTNIKTEKCGKEGVEILSGPF